MKNNDRFITVHSQSGFSVGYAVIVDKETRVQYLWREKGFGAGLTVLLGPDGKPLLYDGEL